MPDWRSVRDTPCARHRGHAIRWRVRTLALLPPRPQLWVRAEEPEPAVEQVPVRASGPEQVPVAVPAVERALQVLRPFPASTRSAREGLVVARRMLQSRPCVPIGSTARVTALTEVAVEGRP